jgi:hypothetical protein
VITRFRLKTKSFFYGGLVIGLVEGIMKYLEVEVTANMLGLDRCGVWLESHETHDIYAISDGP